MSASSFQHRLQHFIRVLLKYFFFQSTGNTNLHRCAGKKQFEHFLWLTSKCESVEALKVEPEEETVFLIDAVTALTDCLFMSSSYTTPPLVVTL